VVEMLLNNKVIESKPPTKNLKFSSESEPFTKFEKILKSYEDAVDRLDSTKEFYKEEPDDRGLMAILL
jgi:hypothetical protein